MSRLRQNNLFGTLGAQLGANATAITFAAVLKQGDGTNLPTIVAPDYYALILEPDSVNEEIVYLTAYTTNTTAGTVTRSAEAPTAPATTIHNISTPWKHGPTALDYSTQSLDVLTWMRVDA
jgi:hypothetical protein